MAYPSRPGSISHAHGLKIVRRRDSNQGTEMELGGPGVHEQLRNHCQATPRGCDTGGHSKRCPQLQQCCIWKRHTQATFRKIEVGYGEPQIEEIAVQMTRLLDPFD